MKQRKINKKTVLWFTLLLALFLIGTNRAVKAEESEVKLKGDCYYQDDYFNVDEVEIVGIRKGVKNPHIPDRIDGKKVTSIWLFGDLEEEKNIDTLTIPRYVDSCGRSASSHKSIKIKKYKVHAKNNYFCIKNSCLYSKDGKALISYPNGKKAESFKVPEGTTEIRSFAFASALVKKVSVPDSVKEIGSFAFEYSKLKTINLPSKLKVIEAATFMGSDIRSIVFPKSLKTIKFSAFQDCKKLKSVTIPKKNHLIDIEEDAFRGCSRLKRFIYPEPILTWKSDDYRSSFYPFIGANAFRSCIHLKKVELPDTLQWLGYKCFYNCRRLEGITLNADNISIKIATFYNCKSLKKVTLKSLSNDPIQIEEGAFQKCRKLKEIRIASKSKKGNIDEEAFVKEGEKKKLTIIAPKDSYAYNYAKKHKKQGLRAKALK